MFFSALYRFLKIEKNFNIQINCSSNKYDISDVELLDGTQKDFLPDVVYFGYTDSIGVGAQPMQCILADNKKVSFHYSCSDMATVSGEQLFAVFNASKQWLQERSQISLYEKLVSHAISSKNLDSVINYASLKLGNCLILCDKNFTIISHSSYIPVTDPIWKENIEKGYCEYDFIQNVMSLDTVKKASYTVDPIEVTCPESPNRKYSSKVFLNGVQVGFVLMIEGDNKATPRNFADLADVSRAISFTISTFSPDIMENYSQDQRLLQNLLIGTPSLKLSEQLSRLHVSDTMYIICVRPTSDRSHKEIKEKICPQIHRIFPEAYMTIHRGDIVLLIPNLSLVTSTETQKTTLTVMAKENLETGISLEFASLDKLHDAYKQAIRVLDWTNKIPFKNNIMWDKRYPAEHYPHRYSEIEFYELLSEIDDPKKLENYIHPAIKRLKEHDNATGNELYKTLKVYIANHHSNNDTAKALNIHRNSLAYRIDKIIEISKADIDDNATGFLLAVSYKIDEYLSIIVNKEN